MSKIKKIVKSVTGALGLGAPDVSIPDAVIPAAPAPMTRTDTGANIIVGSDAVRDARVSGSRTSSSRRATDPLGGLGIGAGLNI